MNSAPNLVDAGISRVVLSAARFRPSTVDADTALLEAWLSSGGNAIDTAHVYGDDPDARGYGDGSSEHALGEVLRRSDHRADVVIITKGGEPNVDRKRVTPEDITSDLRDSLARLQTDYIDVYLVHKDDPKASVGPIVDVLNEHREAGRIKWFGASNWSTDRLDLATDHATRDNVSGLQCSSPQFSLAKPNLPPWPGGLTARDAVSEQWYRDRQLPLFAWSSLARGFFSGRSRAELLNDPHIASVYDNTRNWERLERVRQLAATKDTSTATIALAWVLNQSFPTYAVTRVSSIDRLEGLSAAAQMKLTPAETRWLDVGDEVET